MKNRSIRTAKYLLFLFIGIFLLYLAFRGADLEKMFVSMRTANYSWIIAGMILGALTFVSRGIRWLILIDSLGYKAKGDNSVYSVTMGYLANLALPRIGEVTRCTALNQVEKIPVDKLFGTILVERAIDMVILIGLFFLTLITNFDTFGGFFYNVFSEKARQSAGLWMYGVIAGSFLLLLGVLFYTFRERIRQTGVYIKVHAVWKGIVEGFRTIFTMRKKWAFLFHTVLIWTMYYFMTYLCFFSLDATRHLTPGDGFFILVAGGLGMAAPTQGGIGAYHWMVRESLEIVGVQEDLGLLFATLVHTSQVLMILVTGSFSMLMLSIARSKRRKAEKQETGKAAV